MPTYDYICEDCQYSFEHFQSMNSEPLEVCPKCGGHIKRKIGAGLSPIFKGSGFYQTDYKAAPVETGSSATTKVPDKTETPAVESKPAPASPPPSSKE